MTLQEIKAAVDAGKVVHWGNKGYTVVKDKHDQYLVVFTTNQHATGLTWTDGVTMDYKESDFFIGE